MSASLCAVESRTQAGSSAKVDAVFQHGHEVSIERTQVAARGGRVIGLGSAERTR